MEKRTAVIVFNRSVLRDGHLDFRILNEMTDYLPEDIRIVGIYEDFSRDTVGFMVESKEFKITKETESLPLITATFTHHYEEDQTWVECDNVDLYQTLEPKRVTVPDAKLGEYRSYKKVDMEGSKNIKLSTYLENYNKNESVTCNLPPGFAVDYSKFFTDSSNLPDRIVERPVDGNLTNNTCKHEWKKYEGLQEIYNYCVNCDLKKYDS